MEENEANYISLSAKLVIADCGIYCRSILQNHSDKLISNR